MDDNSTRPDPVELEKYLEDNFMGKVKVFHNTERKGLIVTRMEGARRATGEVIVFLDSHMEVTTNWLPPLLDPIKTNRRVATVPNTDGINAQDMGYVIHSDTWNGGD